MKKNLDYCGRILIRFLSKKTIRVMKLTFILSILAISQLWATETYSQMTKLTLKLEDVEIADALKQIENQSEFFFLYSPKLIDVERKVNIDVENESIKDILSNIFDDKVKSVVYDRQIILTPSDVKSISAVIQQLKITGTVTDEKGNQLPGVTVLVKGTSIGVLSDGSGKYVLNNVPQNATLIFSFVGMTTQEIPTEGRSLIDVVLKEQAIGLDEVVVVGYGTQKKVSITGSIATVNTTKLEAIPTSNLSNTLAGRAVGVTISSNSGFVGSSSDILIRGKGTYNNTSPLYVINGIIADKTSFDVLDPNEVENVSFLKDAASASIYGSRAASGVVLVTTKKGKAQKPVFSYIGSYTVQRTTKPIQSYTATQELQYANDEAETYGNAKPYTQEIFDYFKDKNYDLMDYVWRNPSSQQHDLSVTGGSENLTYYMLVGYNRSLGSFYNTEYDRYNFRSNVTAKINKYLSINFDLSGNQRSIDRFYWPYDDAESTTLQDFYRATFNWTRLYPYYVLADGTPTTNREIGYPVNVWHPVELVYNGGYRKMIYRTLNGIIRVDLKIPFVKGLTTSIMANYTPNDYNNKNFIKYNKAYIFQHGSTTNPFVPGPIDFTQTSVHNLSNSYENVNYNSSFNNSYQLNWFLNYDRTFGKHSVAGTLVYEQQESKGTSLYGYAGNLLSSSVDQIFAASQSSDTRWFDGSELSSARESWIGRLHYEYAGKYIAEFSGRYDGSYIFPADSRWGFFPSGSVAWRISEEDFFKVPYISNLKLRGSIGTAGNDEVSAFQFQNNYVLGNSYAFGSGIYTGITAGTPPNLLITWEKSRNYDIGLDFGLFNNKLTGEFDYFYRYSYDILKDRIRIVPSTYGASLSSENYAKMDVRGLEFSLNYDNKIGEFKYSVGANIGWAKDKVIYIDEATGLESWRSAIGHPLDRLWGYEDYGIIRTQAQLDALPAGFTQFGDKPTLGAILFKDIRGANRSEGADGKIDANDETWLSSNAIPRINYGINLEGEWKGFSLSLLFQGVGAYDKMVRTMNTSTGGVFQVGSRPYFGLWTDHWTEENTDAKYPRAAGWGASQYGWEPSRFWMRNGAYLRLKNLNFAYTIPKKWINFLSVDKCQVYVNATNLFYISGFKETDPEQYALDSYPIMKSFTGGLNINF
jgi:TonB-dependent starch-binding outer membrane protein SusC